jgi:hypothetical protein
MFEGKEFAKTIPFTGGQVDVGVDVQEQGMVDGEVAASADKTLFGGLLIVKGSLAATVKLDAVAGVNSLLGKSNNFLAKLIVSAVNALPKAPTA